MPREANAVDFWRGFALVSIFINHIPGIYYERVDPTAASPSPTGRAVRGPLACRWGCSVGRYFSKNSAAAPGIQARCVVAQLNRRHILISGLGVLALLAGAVDLDGQAARPGMAQRGRVPTTPPHADGHRAPRPSVPYFEILPLDVALMPAAPAFVIIDRFAKPLLVPLSLALYFGIVTIPFTVPGVAGRGAVVLQPVHLAGHLRAGLRAVAGLRPRPFCALQTDGFVMLRRPSSSLRRSSSSSAGFPTRPSCQSPSSCFSTARAS